MTQNATATATQNETLNKIIVDNLSKAKSISNALINASNELAKIENLEINHSKALIMDYFIHSPLSTEF